MNLLDKLILENIELLEYEQLEFIKNEIKPNVVLLDEDKFKNQIRILLMNIINRIDESEDIINIYYNHYTELGFEIYHTLMASIKKIDQNFQVLQLYYKTMNNFKKNISILIIKSLYSEEQKLESINLLYNICDNMDAYCNKKINETNETNEIKENSICEKDCIKFFDLIPDAVIIEDFSGKIIYANNASAILFGVDKASNLIGAKKYDFVRCHPDYCAIMMQQDDRIRREKYIALMEKRYIRLNDEKELFLENTANVIVINGIEVILNMIRDVEERKKVEKLKLKVKEKTRLLEEARNNEKMKTEFFANISHELRTPLNVLLGALQLLELISKNDSLETNKDKIKKYCVIMKQNCYRLVRLVNNLIDITKIDAGYFQFHPKTINLVNIVEEITLSVTGYSESKGIRLVFDTNVEERFMNLDPDLIERIMLNLLSNAIKFTDNGGAIYVDINDNNNEIIINVKDTGIGIPDEKLIDIFERFVQVDKSLSRSNEGSGIGLSLVKSLAELQGGKVEIKSKYGVGTDIKVKFPINELDNNLKNKYENNFDRENNIERINIEFSDIYS
ncbi:MAG: PAS domain-containing sensor histidine kinase [Bacillota bacterium]|nr:PAS domain-containing sensor histidine kinase [Bacillota bacterium]